MGISIRGHEVGELAGELARLRETNMTEAIATPCAQNWNASGTSGSWLTRCKSSPRN